MPESENVRPSLVIDEALVERKSYIASAINTTELDVMDMVVDVLERTGETQHQKWEKRLSAERRKKRKAHVMSDLAHKFLVDQKVKTGRPISLQVEIGLVALSQAAEDLLGLGRTKSKHILDRFFSHARESVEQLREVDDKFAAREIDAIANRLDDELLTIQGDLVDRAVMYDEPTIIEQFSALSDEKREEIMEVLKQKLEERESRAGTS